MREPVLTSIEDRIGVIELARADKFNCLSMRSWELIDAAQAAFEADGRVRTMMIRAQGEHFCTGADLDEVKAIRSDRARTKAFIERGHRAILSLEASPLPVIVAVQGLCLAGGLELMLAADIAFAAKTARFGDQHAQYGLVPGWGGSQRLPRLLGTRRALDLMFSAKWLTADEALALGLVNYVTDDDQLRAEAFAYGAKLTERSRRGLAEMKRLARHGVHLPVDEGLSLEADAAVDHILGPDTTEGLAAFEARRKPYFD